MGVEQPDWTDKKGWARGDDADREVERQKSIPAQPESLQPRRPAGESPWAKGEESSKTLTQADLDQIAERQAEEANKLKQFEFRRDLEMVGGTYTHTYTFDGAGYIEESTKVTKPDLISCATATVKRLPEGLFIAFTLEDLRFAAADLMETYPDMLFEIAEDRQKRTLTYTVTLAG